MPFTSKFSLLVLLGVVPVLLASFIGYAAIAFILYNLILIILLLWDYFKTPAAKTIEASRECEEKFSLGAENTVVIKIRNNSDYALPVTIKDEIPLFFNIKKEELSVNVPAHQEACASYVVVPLKRGQFRFGNVYVKYTGLLGLCSKLCKISLEHDYKVYPNIKDLRRFTLSAIRKAQLLQGEKKIRTYGSGTEFESLREYTEGDDYRKINWPATARSDKLIINSYEPQRNQQIFVMVDSSRVMNSEINYIKKLDYAVNSAFLLADFAIRKGDNAGLLVFDSEVKRFVKPGKGMAHFQLIAENLYNIEENLVSADFEGALLYLGRNHKRRSLLCIFTELFNQEEAMQLVKALKSAARNHLPLVITIKDTRIEETADKDIKDSEDIFLKSAAIQLVSERKKIRQILVSNGIACMDIPPDKLSIEVLNRYITMKSMMQI